MSVCRPTRQSRRERSTIISPSVHHIRINKKHALARLIDSTPQQSPGSPGVTMRALSSLSTIITRPACQSVINPSIQLQVRSSPPHQKTRSPQTRRMSDGRGVNPTKHAGPGTALPHPSDRLRGKKRGRDAMRGGRVDVASRRPTEDHISSASRAASRHLLLMRLVLLMTAGRRGERTHGSGGGRVRVSSVDSADHSLHQRTRGRNFCCPRQWWPGLFCSTDVMMEWREVEEINRWTRHDPP
ncbi:hypothetical protein BKA80DRAFT_114348 [Phyllosticta citrichinensis]